MSDKKRDYSKIDYENLSPELAEELFGIGFSSPEGTGTLNASPEDRERVRRLIEWQKASQKMNWKIGND